MSENLSSASHWTSLRYFAAYRLIISSFFLLVVSLFGGELVLGSQNAPLFFWTSCAYASVSVWFYSLLRKHIPAFFTQLTLQISVDILVLTVLMYASGGARSGMHIMLLVAVLAGAGLAGNKQLALFYAALASLSVLAEQAYRFLKLGSDPAEFVRTGMTSVVFFATATGACLLARRLLVSEELARQRGVALANQVKLTALGRLTANIAHEIRNPLSAINHAAELLQEERRYDVQARLTDIILKNGQRLERLVHDVLELGRRSHAMPEPIKVRQFIEGFLEEFGFHEKIDPCWFVLDIPGDAVLFFDRLHLHQIVWNLVSNALRYCRRVEGSIRFRASVHPSISCTELHIIDDGQGISAALCHHVFEPFFTTHGSGTGLGLYIARELSDANNALLVYVDEMQGAHFRIVGRSEAWE